VAPALCAAAGSLIALMLCRPWIGMFAHTITRLLIAAGITLATSLLVFGVMPAGRLAIHNFKDMLLLLVKQKGDFAAGALN
jgi:hypothetical protein